VDEWTVLLIDIDGKVIGQFNGVSIFNQVLDLLPENPQERTEEMIKEALIKVVFGEK
jgi:hypothetical protein